MSEHDWKQKYDELYRMMLGYIRHLHKAEGERDEARARIVELERLLKDISDGFEGHPPCPFCAAIAKAEGGGK